MVLKYRYYMYICCQINIQINTKMLKYNIVLIEVSHERESFFNSTYKLFYTSNKYGITLF